MRKLIEIERNLVDADGDLELALRMDDGTAEFLCPADMLGPMLLMLVSALGRSQAEVGAEGRKAVWPVEDVDHANYEDGSLGLSFRIHGGAELAFQVSVAQLERISTALRSVLDSAKDRPPPGSQKH